MSLAIAAKFALDQSYGGFRDQALAALVYQARLVLTANPADQVQIDFAKRVLGYAESFRESAVWAIVSDPAVHVQTAPLPTEASMIAAMAAAWPVLSHLPILA